MEAKNHNSSPIKKQDDKKGIHQTVKEWLFIRCCQLSANFQVNILLASILIIFQEVQLFAIVARLSQNPTISKSGQMNFINTLSKIIILDFNESSSIYISICLLIAQLITTLAIFIPLQNKSINKFLSKYIIYIFQMTLNIPSILFSINQIIKQNNVGLNLIIYPLSITNNIIFEGFIFDSSIKRQNQNVLARGMATLKVRNIAIILITFLPILQKISSKLFIFYVISMLVIGISMWFYYARNFLFFNQWFMNLKGFMVSFNVSAYLCYIILYLVDNDILSKNVLLFITTFSIFLSTFFKIYRNDIVRNIITYKQLKGQDQTAIYCMFYWHCFKNITQKKDQLYILSLLKRHISQCQQMECCCKNRHHLYDDELKIFGNPNIQPHLDAIFIKNFIFKLLKDGYQKFSKSKLLNILLCTYVIEIIQIPSKIIEFIKKLIKMDHKKQLSLTQQFALYCIRSKLSQKIKSLNSNRGDLRLEDVKQFDKNISILIEDVRKSIKIHNGLWKELNQTQLNESKLYTNFNEGLQIMFKIQQNYEKLIKLNSQSTQLRSIMLFYAKIILHDVHLLSKIRKEVKNNVQNNVIISASDSKILKLHLFGSRTISLISYENSKIKWSSRHAHKIFEYSSEEFKSLSIKNLMPRYFADNHDKFIENWKNTGFYTKLNNTTYLWGRTKQGHCFSILMYAKMIPLHHQQQYAFFSIIQKLDDQNEIVCSLAGQVYGVGKLFTNSISINPKLIQQTNPFIQIFIPSTFQFFFQAYYQIPKTKNYLHLKRNTQKRRQGFFPVQIENILRIMNRQKEGFFSNELKETKNILLNFVRQKMQEITSCIDGQYLSFMMTSQRLSVHKSDKYVILRIINPKRNSVEKYYTELQAMIQKLQKLNVQYNRELKGKKEKNINKTDFFCNFLNPKKMIKATNVFQKAQSNKNIFQNSGNSSEFITLKSKKDTQNIVNHRKLLALSAQYQIKNQKVRYYLWKIKNALLQQGIISRYTYNLLIGKSNYRRDSPNTILLSKSQTYQSKMSLREVYQQNDNIQIGSSSLSSSVQNDSQQQLNKEQSANQTFNSGSSSATFISMTNHVKVFKQKLKSLYTPILLYLLNILTIVAVFCGILGLGFLMYLNFPTLNSGIQQFNNNKQANFIMDTLLLGQINIINLKHNNNSFYQFQKSYYINKTGFIYQRQMFKYPSYKLINPYKLSYLQMKVRGDIQMPMHAFIHKIYTQILTDKFQMQATMFNNAIQKIKVHSNSNKIFINVQKNILKYTIIYVVFIGVLLAIILPVIYRLKLKVVDIYDLLKKISRKEKDKFYHHFNFINEEFKLVKETEDINIIVNSYQNKTKHQYSTIKVEKLKKQQADQYKSQSKSKYDKIIFVKITAFIFAIIAAVIGKYYYKIYYFIQLHQASRSFTQVFNEKTQLTHSIILAQFQLLGYKKEYQTFGKQIKLQNAIYNTFHLPGVSDDYKNFIYRFTSGQCCDLIAQKLNPQYYQLCKKVNNQVFSQGCFDNIFHSQGKMKQRLSQYYKTQNSSNNNNENNFIFAQYFKSTEYKDINAAYFFNSLMVFTLYEQIQTEMNRFNIGFKYQLIISNTVLTIILLLFLVYWFRIYFKISEQSSKVNAFLLLIPYEILSQNPYVKLYIRKQFDFKTGND